MSFQFFVESMFYSINISKPVQRKKVLFNYIGSIYKNNTTISSRKISANDTSAHISPNNETKIHMPKTFYNSYTCNFEKKKQPKLNIGYLNSLNRFCFNNILIFDLLWIDSSKHVKLYDRRLLSFPVVSNVSINSLFSLHKMITWGWKHVLRPLIHWCANSI